MSLLPSVGRCGGGGGGDMEAHYEPAALCGEVCGGGAPRRYSVTFTLFVCPLFYAAVLSSRYYGEGGADLCVPTLYVCPHSFMCPCRYYGEGADVSTVRSWRRKLLSFAHCNRPAFYGSFTKTR